MTIRIAPFTQRDVILPPSVLAPAAVVLVAFYPAVWNPAQPIRRVFSTIMILGIVWLVTAGVTTLLRELVAMTDKVIDRQVQRIRRMALDELDQEWRDLVERMTERPGDDGPPVAG